MIVSILFISINIWVLPISWIFQEAAEWHRMKESLFDCKWLVTLLFPPKISHWSMFYTRRTQLIPIHWRVMHCNPSSPLSDVVFRRISQEMTYALIDAATSEEIATVEKRHKLRTVAFGSIIIRKEYFHSLQYALMICTRVKRRNTLLWKCPVRRVLLTHRRWQQTLSTRRKCMMNIDTGRRKRLSMSLKSNSKETNEMKSSKLLTDHSYPASVVWRRPSDVHAKAGSISLSIASRAAQTASGHSTAYSKCFTELMSCCLIDSY